MKIKKIFILIFSLLILTACSGNKEEMLVEDFLTTYFNQTNFSEAGWEKIEKNLFSIGTEKLKEPYKDYLNDDTILKLIQNRVIPAFYLKDTQITYKINSFEKSDDGLIANLTLTSNDKNIDFKLKFQFNNGKINWFDHTTLIKNILKLKEQSA